MPVDAELGKSEKEMDKYNHRKSNFYSQTIAENNARLLAKFPDDPNLRSELEFIHADIIVRGQP